MLKGTATRACEKGLMGMDNGFIFSFTLIAPKWGIPELQMIKVKDKLCQETKAKYAKTLFFNVNKPSLKA